MTIKVLVFGVAKEIVGDNSVDVKVKDGCTVATLKAELDKTVPNLPDFLIAINAKYAFDNQLVRSSDEVALIPPTNGG